MQEPTMQELRDEKLAGDYRDDMAANDMAEQLAGDYRDEMTASDMAEKIQGHINSIKAANYAITAALADVMDHPESYFRVVDGRIVKR